MLGVTTRLRRPADRSAAATRSDKSPLRQTFPLRARACRILPMRLPKCAWVMSCANWRHFSMAAAIGIRKTYGGQANGWRYRLCHPGTPPIPRGRFLWRLTRNHGMFPQRALRTCLGLTLTLRLLGLVCCVLITPCLTEPLSMKEGFSLLFSVAPLSRCGCFSIRRSPIASRRRS